MRHPAILALPSSSHPGLDNIVTTVDGRIPVFRDSYGVSAMSESAFMLLFVWSVFNFALTLGCIFAIGNHEKRINALERIAEQSNQTF